ncbi:hypothetical protein EON66_00790 [archaeon]|nr:MAG: hypothetical protein EON66_00790 [archaeon]
MQIDPEMEGPVLPTRSSEDYRPFDRKVPEFTCWYVVTTACDQAK